MNRDIYMSNDLHRLSNPYYTSNFALYKVPRCQYQASA